AIPILERRLQFADQREGVQRELDLAREQAGQEAPAGKAKGNGNGKAQGSAKHDEDTGPKAK
ncbi:MAG: hypothetical protein LC713_02870, partial [Actinobacteria bacterium]|nr:hypothetical protein [Actinomycetota bacterium]